MQNIFALAAVTLLAEAKIINGNAALVSISAILGIIALPAVRKGGGTGTVGVIALLWKPLTALLVGASTKVL